MITLRVNGKTYQADAEPTTPLLWVLRDSIGLTGTKYGCVPPFTRGVIGHKIGLVLH